MIISAVSERLSDPEDDLATGVPCFCDSVGLGRVGEVKDSIDVDLETACLDQVGYTGKADRVGLDQESSYPPPTPGGKVNDLFCDIAGDGDKHPPGAKDRERALAVFAGKVNHGIEVRNEVLETFCPVVDDLIGAN
jgi:hypothetical protein